MVRLKMQRLKKNVECFVFASSPQEEKRRSKKKIKGAKQETNEGRERDLSLGIDVRTPDSHTNNATKILHTSSKASRVLHTWLGT